MSNGAPQIPIVLWRLGERSDAVQPSLGSGTDIGHVPTAATAETHAVQVVRLGPTPPFHRASWLANATGKGAHTAAVALSHGVELANVSSDRVGHRHSVQALGGLRVEQLVVGPDNQPMLASSCVSRAGARHSYMRLEHCPVLHVQAVARLRLCSTLAH